jgi:hypothetical protein
MGDDELQKILARMQSGSTMTTAGVVVLVLSFLGTCVAAAGAAGDPNANPGAKGVEIGQSPWLMGALVLGIALIAVGQARKSNARRAMEERHRLDHTSIEVVPDPAVPGGPFRGGMKEVEVLDPDVAAAEQAQKERDRRRGNGYLIAGGMVMAATVIVMLLGATGGNSHDPHAAEKVFMAMGLALFPFGLGLYFAIKGMLLRSK